MIIKSIDDKSPTLTTLESLVNQAEGSQKKQIESELRNLRAGIKGEEDAAYYIDFDLAQSKNWVVIHDLRLEVAGRVAQIDHLLINRVLEAFVLETKSFHAGLKITEEGEFLRWNDWKKTYEGMASPLAQNERHVAVLKDAVKEIELPSRLGLRLEPTFQSYVLISPKARIDRPKKFDTSRIVKADVFIKTIRDSFENESTGKTLLSVAKVVGQETLEQLGRRIASLHRPASIDYRGRFGTVDEKPAAAMQTSTDATSTCRQCSSSQVSIVHGKYGYYFKCQDCDGNTPIKVGCGQPGHKERIRKEGARFFRECAECKTSSLFFTNSDG